MSVFLTPLGLRLHVDGGCLMTAACILAVCLRLCFTPACLSPVFIPACLSMLTDGVCLSPMCLTPNSGDRLQEYFFTEHLRKLDNRVLYTCGLEIAHLSAVCLIPSCSS
ncbi:MAG: hypothetical protein E7370_03985 [Clostridiales bacterium]|nr:hypothetical protein [Clostridiales bacterium]